MVNREKIVRIFLEEETCVFEYMWGLEYQARKHKIPSHYG
jgi:hypothetical protein